MLKLQTFQWALQLATARLLLSLGMPTGALTAWPSVASAMPCTAILALPRAAGKPSRCCHRYELPALLLLTRDSSHQQQWSFTDWALVVRFVLSKRAWNSQHHKIVAVTIQVLHA